MSPNSRSRIWPGTRPPARNPCMSAITLAYLRSAMASRATFVEPDSNWVRLAHFCCPRKESTSKPASFVWLKLNSTSGLICEPPCLGLPLGPASCGGAVLGIETPVGTNHTARGAAPRREKALSSSIKSTAPRFGSKLIPPPAVCTFFAQPSCRMTSTACSRHATNRSASRVTSSVVQRVSSTRSRKLGRFCGFIAVTSVP